MWYSTTRSGRSAVASMTCDIASTMPASDTPLKKKGGISKAPQAPTSCAWRVSAMVSGSAAQLTETRMRAAGTPPAIRASTASRRSVTENEGPSPVVPKGVTPPQPASIKERAWAAKRVWSMLPSARSGVISAGQMPGSPGAFMGEFLKGFGGGRQRRPGQAEHAPVGAFDVVGQAGGHLFGIAALERLDEPQVLLHRRHQ